MESVATLALNDGSTDTSLSSRRVHWHQVSDENETVDHQPSRRHVTFADQVNVISFASEHLQINQTSETTPAPRTDPATDLATNLATDIAAGQAAVVEDQHRPNGSFENSQILPHQDSIFVSVASYRDPETVRTLEDIFLKARHPQRVFVGVCQQNADDDADCLESDALVPYLSQIRILRLSHFEAEGPMYARALIEQELFQNEMYFLQLDSHMLLVDAWDDLCIHQLALCPSQRPILTTYPHDFDRDTRKFVVLKNGQKRILGSVPSTYIRFREFHKRLKFTEQEKETFTEPPSRPVPSLLWAAGFSFSLGELVRQVPYDPFCSFVFVGEEMSMAARYFTHGWDFFAPSINIAYHLLKRTYRKTFWEQVYRKNSVVDTPTRLMHKQMEAEGVMRIRELMRGHLQSDENVHRLGDVRTLQEWQDYVGIDLFRQQASARAFAGLSPHADAEEVKCKRKAAFLGGGSSGNMHMQPHKQMRKQPQNSAQTQRRLPKHPEFIPHKSQAAHLAALLVKSNQSQHNTNQPQDLRWTKQTAMMNRKVSPVFPVFQ